MISKTATILVPTLSDSTLYLFESNNIEEICVLILRYLHLKALIPLTANHNEGSRYLSEADTETWEQFLDLFD